MSKLDQLKALGAAKWERLNASTADQPTNSVRNRDSAGRNSGLLVQGQDQVEPKRTVETSKHVSGSARQVAVNQPSPLKPGRPLNKNKDKTLAATKPWEAEGVSRRTWYRNREKGK